MRLHLVAAEQPLATNKTSLVKPSGKKDLR